MGTRGLFRYTTSVEVLEQPFYAKAFPYASDLPYRVVAPEGSEITLFLKGYRYREPTLKTNNHTSVATAKVRQTRHFPSLKGEKVVISNVQYDREGFNEYAMYDGIVAAAETGEVLYWYPDYENYPDEFKACYIENVKPPRPTDTLGRFEFTFDLLFEDEITFPSTALVFS